MKLRVAISIGILLCIGCTCAQATIFGQLQGIVHDPQHRPVAGASVLLKSATSDYAQSSQTNQEGAFAFAAIPLGNYVVSITQTGFDPLEREITIVSETSSILHFQLTLGTVKQSTSVTAESESVSTESATPSTLVDRIEIAQTPGADRTNGLQMITNYVPGSYETHDMLHMRGGHQVTWQVDGVEIPNTNVGSNVGTQIDPKDIDYLEVQRGSYNSDIGDRTYGVFNVVPRSGFERSNEGELVMTGGNFYQTNDQISVGSHNEKAAYYASVNGNRSNLGLQPPVSQIAHDADNGYGGFASFIYNETPHDQFRLITQLRRDYFQIPYDPNRNDWESQFYDSSRLRDWQHETDGVLAFSWVHTFSSSSLLQVSPFYHYNSANYDSNPNDQPVATTAHRASHYLGMQASVTGQFARNTLQAGIYTFAQNDGYLFGARFNDGSLPNLSESDIAGGGVFEEFVSDTFKPASWLTLIGGVRVSHFRGSNISEDKASPRTGIALQIPHLNWVFRGFYGRFYQPPPLLSVSGPLLDFADSQNTSFVPLHGERDEELQFGVQIPLRGWVLDIDTFRTRANNFLDHSNLGASSIYFPVTIDGALIRGWETTLRSPRLRNKAQIHLAYANQIALQRGAIVGGLIPVGEQCNDGCPYRPVDHDQRNTLNVGLDTSLPWSMYGSTNVYYGSGFSNGITNSPSPFTGAYLPQHTTFDLSLGKKVGENMTVSINLLNVANRRLLEDNSLTFGGFHYNRPREIYGEVRYRFHY